MARWQEQGKQLYADAKQNQRNEREERKKHKQHEIRRKHARQRESGERRLKKKQPSSTQTSLTSFVVCVDQKLHCNRQEGSIINPFQLHELGFTFIFLPLSQVGRRFLFYFSSNFSFYSWGSAQCHFLSLPPLPCLDLLLVLLVVQRDPRILHLWRRGRVLGLFP